MAAVHAGRQTLRVADLERVHQQEIHLLPGAPGAPETPVTPETNCET